MHARLLAASKGGIAVNSVLLLDDELQKCYITHDIDEEREKVLKELDSDFECMFKSPPAWWGELSGKYKFSTGGIIDPHADRALALDYARDHAVRPML